MKKLHLESKKQYLLDFVLELESDPDSSFFILRQFLKDFSWKEMINSGNSEILTVINQLIKQSKLEDIVILVNQNQETEPKISLFLISEMCKHSQFKSHVAELLNKTITRADMICDFMKIYWRNGKTPISAQIRKGLAKSFNNFSEEEFSKYDTNKKIKIKDVMFMVHPKPLNSEKELLFNKIANSKLLKNLTNVQDN